jgi:superfamily II DNA/RNA helicase
MPAERQTMLFSATLPNWVAKVAKRYQKSPTTIDLVGEEQTGKLNEDVTLNIMQVRQQRNWLLASRCRLRCASSG